MSAIHRQETPWSCGPAALKVLFDHLGHQVAEDRLVDLTGSDPAGGTTHEGLTAAARALGYRVAARSGASLGDLQDQLTRGPVLVDFQGKHGGHYAVVISYSPAGRVELEDPHRKGADRYSLDDHVFFARWYSRTYPEGRYVPGWMMSLAR